jgi:hypothetical protein
VSATSVRTGLVGSFQSLFFASPLPVSASALSKAAS